jgi:hypothetical protein
VLLRGSALHDDPTLMKAVADGYRRDRMADAACSERTTRADSA